MAFTKIVFTAAIIFFSSLLFSQDVKPAISIKTSKIYFYSFTGALNSESAELLKSEIERMRFVNEVKIEYKVQKSAGQIRLLATEFYTDNDTDFEFNVYDLKMLLIRNNLAPLDYKFEVVSK